MSKGPRREDHVEIRRRQLATGAISSGTESLLTHRWEMDSNHWYRGTYSSQPKRWWRKSPRRKPRPRSCARTLSAAQLTVARTSCSDSRGDRPFWWASTTSSRSHRRACLRAIIEVTPDVPSEPPDLPEPVESQLQAAQPGGAAAPPPDGSGRRPGCSRRQYA